MPVHVHSLPDDCLLVIFDRVPLLNLLGLDRVCLRWRTLLPSACTRRRTLYFVRGEFEADLHFHIPFSSKVSVNGCRLFYDHPALKPGAAFALPGDLHSFMSYLFYEMSFYDQPKEGFFDILYRTTIGGQPEAYFTELARLKRARLSGQLVAYFTGLFPNVDTLEVIHLGCGEAELKLLIDLLRSTSWSLRIVKLWIRTSNYSIQDKNLFLTLLESINQLSSLRQLTLDIDDYYNDGVGNFNFPLKFYAFIARLNVLRLFLGLDHRNLTYDLVHRFDHSELRHIGLGKKYYQPLASAFNHDFTIKVDQLYSKQYWSFENVKLFGDFCFRFPSLIFVQITWKPYFTFTQLVSNLAMLEQLTHLKLAFDLEEQPEDAFALVGDDGEQLNISLSRVKILELSIKSRSHREFESLAPEVFPSIEVIVLYDNSQTVIEGMNMLRCDICQVHPRAQGDYHCHGMLVDSLISKFFNSLVKFYSKIFLQWDRWTYQWNYYKHIENVGQIGDDEQIEEVEEKKA